MLTKEQKKKLKSKDWRVKHLYKIKDKEAKTVTFKRNEAQLDFQEKKHTRNIILKSRQLGFTTDETIDMFDDVLFNKNFDALMIAHEKDAGEEIFDNKIDFAWKNLDIKELYNVDTNTKRTMKFDFGDNTQSSIAVAMSGRSGTYQRIHISEFGKMCKKYPQKAKEIISGTIPAVPMHGRVDIESTAEGEEGQFHDMFWEAWDRGEPEFAQDYKAHFYNWTWDKAEISKVEKPIENLPAEFIEYQELHELSDLEISYYYLKWLSLGKKWKVLRQEYPTTPEEAFIYSGNKLFDQEVIQKRMIQLRLNPPTIEKANDWIYYEKYKPHHIYALGADVAQGVGQDSSTVVIVDFTPDKPKVVAEYANNEIEPDKFAYVIKKGAERYGGCFAAVENNNKGHSTLVKLNEIYPENLIYKSVRKGKEEEKETDVLGWETNAATKPRMMFDISTAVEDNLIDIPSKLLYSEMRTYNKEDLGQIRFDDEQTKHWDRLIALAIVWQMRLQVDMFKDQVVKVYNTRSGKVSTPPKRVEEVSDSQTHLAYPDGASAQQPLDDILDKYSAI